jgi:ubiquinone/menaquinone biosynthesis C-methylase UbiE
MIGDSYDDVDGHVPDADLGLGCGIPTEHAGLAPGQTVVDLGSGAGIDAFVARRTVGAAGQVIGVDFTPEMIEKARANATALGAENVRFLQGDIEDLPLDDDIADVVLSNCVLNLVPDKERAFAEMYRVLRPGGHFCVSDIVTRGTLPDAVRQSLSLHAGCVAGALDEEVYLEKIAHAGFEAVEVREQRRIEVPEDVLPESLSRHERASFTRDGLWSVTVRGRVAA